MSFVVKKKCYNLSIPEPLYVSEFLQIPRMEWWNDGILG